MSNSDQSGSDAEIERLRDALDAETRARLEIQRQLERANTEFEEFVSVAAHNLRESLREVASYGQLMAETYASRLDSDAGEFLGRIREATVRMQSLLADVVDYWSTETHDPESARTDMEAVVRQAILSMDTRISARSAIVTHDPLPRVCADFETLTKVMRHLLRNAIEYCSTASPRIHISSRRADRECVFSVQDNGPGIDPAFQQRIFGAFKRLHGKEYPGNGLGLTFCKRSIQRFGGRIWVESAPGAGSTFYFTLPAAD